MTDDFTCRLLCHCASQRFSKLKDQRQRHFNPPTILPTTPPVARRRGVRQSLTQGEHRRRNCLLRAHTRKLSKASAPSGFLSRRSLMKRLLIIVSASAHSQSSYGRRRFQVRPVSMPLKFCYPFTAGVVSTAPPHYTPLYPTHVPLVKVSTLSLLHTPTLPPYFSLSPYPTPMIVWSSSVQPCARLAIPATPAPGSAPARAAG